MDIDKKHVSYMMFDETILILMNIGPFLNEIGQFLTKSSASCRNFRADFDLPFQMNPNSKNSEK